jgi:hypothetical protein
MSTSGDYDAVREDIKQLIPNAEYKDGYGPIFVRLAWHASGTYDKNTKTGGSNGATMRFSLESSDAANAGLDIARDRLEPVKEKHPWISCKFSFYLKRFSDHYDGLPQDFFIKKKKYIFLFFYNRRRSLDSCRCCCY